jgi:Glu-tRNA(Gln) amidotransferase subunit E-like FAD-binding protein
VALQGSIRGTPFLGFEVDAIAHLKILDSIERIFKLSPKQTRAFLDAGSWKYLWLHNSWRGLRAEGKLPETMAEIRFPGLEQARVQKRMTMSELERDVEKSLGHKPRLKKLTERQIAKAKAEHQARLLRHTMRSVKGGRPVPTRCLHDAPPTPN